MCCPPDDLGSDPYTHFITSTLISHSRSLDTIYWNTPLTLYRLQHSFKFKQCNLLWKKYTFRNQMRLSATSTILVILSSSILVNNRLHWLQYWKTLKSKSFRYQTEGLCYWATNEAMMKCILCIQHRSYQRLIFKHHNASYFMKSYLGQLFQLISIVIKCCYCRQEVRQRDPVFQSHKASSGMIRQDGDASGPFY